MNTNAPAIEEQESPLDPDEPHTPTWFTFLGVGLFLFGGIFLLATSGEEVEPPAPSTQPVEEVAPGDPSDPEPSAAPSADPHAGHGHD